MKQAHQIIVGIAILIIGFGLGYGLRETQPLQMNHVMPDGSMMKGDAKGGMQGAMDGMTLGLQGKTGDAFDKAFLSEMIMHHQGAVVMAQAVLATSKRPELIKLANDIISAQTQEIDMMSTWLKEWFR